MSKQESRPTTYKIFSNGINQPEYPGVSDESVYDFEKQIYVPRKRFNQIIESERTLPIEELAG